MTRHAENGARQIVGAEAEKIRTFGDLSGAQGSAWQFDQRADPIADGATGLLLNFLATRSMIPRTKSNSRLPMTSGTVISNVTCRIAKFLQNITRRHKHRADLHIRNFGVGNRQSAPPMAKDRDDLAHRRNPPPHRVNRKTESLRRLSICGITVRQDLIERRIKQADGNRKAAQLAEQLGEIGPLQRE